MSVATSWRGRLRQLPAPFEKVSVRCMTDWSDVAIEYTGSANTLIECGAIESTMVQKVGKGKARYDSHGDHYRRRALPNGRLHVTRYVSTLERVLSLPGGCIDPESRVARLLANPTLVLYERNNCWHHWYGSKERLARELDFSNIPDRSATYGADSTVGLCGFLNVAWCEGYGSDPRLNGRTEYLQRRIAEIEARTDRMSPAEVLERCRSLDEALAPQSRDRRADAPRLRLVVNNC